MKPRIKQHERFSIYAEKDAQLRESDGHFAKTVHGQAGALPLKIRHEAEDTNLERGMPR